MAMTDSGTFIDYYSILQVDWDCDTKSLEYAYRYLAKLYHPDHAETADVQKFNEVIEAYRALRTPDQRAEYDLLYTSNMEGVWHKPFSNKETQVGEKAALQDAEAHEKTLHLLYNRRREHASDAGVPPFSVQEMLKCSDKYFEFLVWYLKAKGLIEATEQGTLAITIEGVDHVISTSRTKAEKLRIAQSGDSQN